MATHQGEEFLEAQLASLMDQSHQDWRLWVSDDGSTDGTRALLAAFAKANPERLAGVQDGPCKGSAANFFSLLSLPQIAGSWVAFSDQDDVWMPHKLARAIAQIENGKTDRIVYSSRSVHTDENLKVRRVSRRFDRPFGYGNALVQNVLAGSTIVMPPAVTDIMKATCTAAQKHAVPFHDWWTYQVASACGVGVLCDNEPGLYYRQHGNNEMGAGVARKYDRMRSLLSKEFAAWITRNLAAFDDIEDLMQPEARDLKRKFEDWRGKRPLDRPSPQKIGIYRQSRSGDATLAALAALAAL